MDDKLIKNVANDKFAALLGIKLTDVREGYAVTELVLNENHLNGVGKVQGGVIFTLADYAFAAASNSGGCATVGLNVNITYFKSPSGKKIIAEARELSVQNRISGYRIDVLDEDRSLIASFSGLGYRKAMKEGT
jgi:acyl-CoA thioesterase